MYESVVITVVGIIKAERGFRSLSALLVLKETVTSEKYYIPILDSLGDKSRTWYKYLVSLKRVLNITLKYVRENLEYQVKKIKGAIFLYEELF